VEDDIDRKRIKIGKEDIMGRFVALLRGINISGKNKIAMPELKAAMESAGFQKVKTHLNSGNIAFDSKEAEEGEDSLSGTIHELIAEKFELDIPVFVIGQEELGKLLEQSPEWWGNDNKDIYDNLIFIMGEVKASDISEKIGVPTEGLEQVLICDNSIFWSFDRKKYQKCSWWKKTAAAGIAEVLTIRTANTVRKIAGL